MPRRSARYCVDHISVSIRACRTILVHYIDLYPAIYKGKETRPINYHLPQLTGDQDHPGEDLPIFHFAFEVTLSGLRARLCDMIDLMAAYATLTSHAYQSWYAITLRPIVGYGFVEHGYAKIARGPEKYASILHALGMPAPEPLAWTTILVELCGGLAVFLGAFIPLASIPMAIVLLVAILTVHVPNGFSSIKLLWDKGQQHLPGDEAWLIGEHRTSGEKKYYLSNLPAEMNLHNLAATIKARWICEQAHQQLKEELGLDHFQGRSWHGLHASSCIDDHDRVRIPPTLPPHKVRWEKKNQRPATSTDLASRPARHRQPDRSIKPSAVSVLPKPDRRRKAA
jgi:uncharacterized membrane protein YphA (DoxX/SURF4 family)